MNEPGAQTLAALAGAAQRVSAPTAARVIDAHYQRARGPEDQDVRGLELPAPAPMVEQRFPALAPVYAWAALLVLALLLVSRRWTKREDGVT